jgi:uncharacterized protein Yka (UPF0111/DUF47 family)
VLLESIKNLLQPGDKLIYKKFNAQVDLLKAIINRLNESLIIENEAAHSELFSEVRAYYLLSAETYRNNTAHLAKTFITPIDRESVHELYIRLHSASRSAYLVSRSLGWSFPLSKNNDLIRMSELLVNASLETEELVKDIGTAERLKVMKFAGNLHRLRREADMTYEQALQKLYKEELMPGDFVRRLEMLTAIRDAVEYCQEVAHCGENIALTNIG